MKLNELDKNKVYTVIHQGTFYIFKQDGDISNCYNISESKRFYTGGNFSVLQNCSESLATIEEANYIEIQWLEECIKQMTLVPLHTIKLINQTNYEIY